MTLKAQLLADLDAVFYDAGGFAEEAVYNTKPVLIIPDSGMIQSTSVPGYMVQAQRFRVRAADVARPKPGDKVVLAGLTWHVTGTPTLDAGEWVVDVDQDVKSLGV